MRILAIDPGNEESAYVLVETPSLKVIEFGKQKNKNIQSYIHLLAFDEVAIEMVACYGMPVGQTVFDTCRWIGRYEEYFISERRIKPQLIYRRDEKLNLCGTARAKDSNIIQALVDRFAPHDTNKGKGTKKNPGWFYGFSKDVWQAYAIAVTYYDLYLKEDTNDRKK